MEDKGNDFAWDGLETNDSCYVVIGYSNSSASGDVSGTTNGGQDFWVVKLDSTGNVIWDKLLGGSADELAFSVKQTSDNGYIVVGRSSSSANGDVSDANNGIHDYWIVKLDNAGNIEWDKLYGGSGSDIPIEVQELSGGGYIIGGYSTSSKSGDVVEPNHGNNDFWILKLDASGNIQN